MRNKTCLIGRIVATMCLILSVLMFYHDDAVAAICGRTPCVDSADIINGQVTGQDIAVSVVVPGSRIVDESVTGADIQNGSLTGADIQDGSAGSADITAIDAVAGEKGAVDELAKARVQEAYSRLPLYFIPNDGQVDKEVMFYERSHGHAAFFTREGVYLTLIKDQGLEDRRDKGERGGLYPESEITGPTFEMIKLTPVGANKDPEIVPEGLQHSKVNYFIGNDPEKWRTDIPTFKALLYKEVYEGIDIRYYGNNRQLEYDVLVKPGADPSIVRFAYEGIEGLKVTEEGDLEISLGEEKLTQKRPHIYQEIEDKRIEVEGRFLVSESEYESSPVKGSGSTDRDNRQDKMFSYSFEVASYDKTLPLIIDPPIIYSTYQGGNYGDYGEGICVEADFAYITGYTYSTNFPAKSPIQWINAGGADAFVMKIDSTGQALVYSTYLGGSGHDYGLEIKCRPNVSYITGYTNSTNFPTKSPIQGTNAGGYDAFITEIDSTGSMLLFSTYLGGSLSDYAMGIDFDNARASIYITGYTLSTNFPTKYPIQATNKGESDAFVAGIDTTTPALLFSTYLGGSGSDQGYDVGFNIYGEDVYITGYTSSTDFPTKTPVQGAYAGGGDAFVTKIKTTGIRNIVYSTYLGGSGDDFARGIYVDTSFNVYTTGYTNSTDFPTKSPIQGTNAGGCDVFVTKISNLPDLVVYIDTSTVFPTPGQNVSVTVTFWNRRGDASGSFYVDFYKDLASAPVPYQSGNLWCSLNGLGSGMERTYSGNVSYTAEGIYQMWAQVDTDKQITEFDENNNISWPRIIRVDGTAPYGKISINGGASYTISPSVILQPFCSDNVSGCDQNRFSNDNVTWSFWEFYAFDKAWTLTSGDGTKTVYVQFKDNAGNTSAIFSDDIILDQTLPVVSVVLDTNSTSVPRGGTLGYTVTVTNNAYSSQTFQYWTYLILPNGSRYPATSELIGPVTVTLVGAGQTKSVHLTYKIPSSAPLGSYTYLANVGSYPTLGDSNSFQFTVTTALTPEGESLEGWELLENGLTK